MTALAQSPALLLRAQARGEDDVWVTLLTPEYGRIHALAKGARGSKRRFGTCLQPFHLFHAQWRQRAGLSFLAGASPLEQPLGSDPSLPVLMAGWLFLELAEQVSHPGQPKPALFELVLGGLKRLGKGAEAPEAVRLSMLLAVLELEGWAPDLSLCARCGKPAPWAQVVLSAPAGGCLCPQCARPQDGPALGAAVLEQWQSAQAGRPLKEPLPGAEGPLLRWIEHHLGQALKVAALQSHAHGALS